MSTTTTIKYGFRTAITLTWVNIDFLKTYIYIILFAFFLHPLLHSVSLLRSRSLWQCFLSLSLLLWLSAVVLPLALTLRGGASSRSHCCSRSQPSLRRWRGQYILTVLRLLRTCKWSRLRLLYVIFWVHFSPWNKLLKPQYFALWIVCIALSKYSA